MPTPLSFIFVGLALILFRHRKRYCAKGATTLTTTSKRAAARSVAGEVTKNKKKLPLVEVIASALRCLRCILARSMFETPPRGSSHEHQHKTAKQLLTVSCSRDQYVPLREYFMWYYWKLGLLIALTPRGPRSGRSGWCGEPPGAPPASRLGRGCRRSASGSAPACKSLEPARVIAWHRMASFTHGGEKERAGERREGVSCCSFERA